MFEKLQFSRLNFSGFMSAADGDGPVRSSSPIVGSSQMSKLSPSDSGSDGDSGIGLPSPSTVGSFDFYDDCTQLSASSSSSSSPIKCAPIQSSTPNSSSINWSTSSDEGSDADFDHDEALLDETTAFESELSWDDESSSSSSSDRGYSRSRGDFSDDSGYDSRIVDSLSDTVRCPSLSPNSRSKPIACANRIRSRRGEKKRYFTSTPNDFAGPTVELRCGYPMACEEKTPANPPHHLMYKYMQELSLEAKPCDEDIFRSSSTPHDPFWDVRIAPTLSCISS